MKKQWTIILSLAVMMGLAGCSRSSEAESTALQTTEAASEETAG